MTKLLAYCSFVDGDRVCLMNSRGDGVSDTRLSELAHWLKYSKTDGAVRVTFNLDTFLAPVLRRMPLPMLDALAKQDNSASIVGDTMFYALHKMFRIRQAYYYNINEFWQTGTPEPTNPYELQAMADELSEVLDKLGMGDFQKIASPIAIFEQTALGKATYEQIPRDYEVPQEFAEMLEYADKADRHEWISNYQVGVWDKAYDWDISACYSSIAARLPDLRDLDYWQSNEIGSRELGAAFGFVKGLMFIDPASPVQHCSPIMVRDIGNDTQGNPAGWIPGCFSLDEVKLVEERGLGKFYMSNGYFAEPKPSVAVRYPFRSIMDWFYDHRNGSPMMAKVVKQMANQLIGKMIERLKWRGNSTGELYNSVYHALVTAGGRVAVSRFLLDNEVDKSELLCVQTDGVKILKSLPPPTHNGMGSWRLNNTAPCLIATPNVVLMSDKKPQHYTYEQIISEVKRHPLQGYYGVLSEQRTTLGQALELGDIRLVGEVRELPAHLDLYAIPRQQNRVFSKLPVSGRQLLNGHYQSEPIILGGE